MQPQPSPPAPTSLPRLPSSGSSGSLATLLAVLALVLALVAISLNFVIPGPAGPSGSTAVPNETLWAVVASNGATTRSAGVTSSAQVSTGVYNVSFDQILYGCSFVANPGMISTGTESASTATVKPQASSVRSVEVDTFANSLAANLSFHLVATCPGGLSAVVAANGTFVSGAGVNDSENSAVGRYTVIFNQDVSGCAYIATLGESGSIASGSVTTASRSGTPAGVWVATYDASGASANAAFRLSVYC